MLLPDATKQWLYQTSHAVVVSSRVLGSVPCSYADRLCNQRQVTSAVSCSLPKQGTILHSGHGEEEKNNFENRIEVLQVIFSARDGALQIPNKCAENWSQI